MTNNWDRWPPRGDPTEEAVFVAVGRFLTKWEKLEMGCAEAYAAFVTMGSFETTIAMRSFGTVSASRSRTDMLKQAAEAYQFLGHEDGIRDHVGTLLNAYTDHASRRNEIAHGVVLRYANLTYALGEEVVGPVRPGFVLVPAEYNARKIHLNGAPKYVYDAAAIDRLVENFWLLQTEIRSVAVAIIKKHNPSYQSPLGDPELA